MAVDTTKAERRTLGFASIPEIRRDLDALGAAERAGTLRTTGNWTPGQIMTHLAAFMDYGYVGYPKELNPPFFVKWILKLNRAKYLRKGLPSGVKIPGIPGGTVGAENVAFDEGMRRLRAALDQLERTPVKYHSPGFGVMPQEEIIGFACRHCELHLSFMHPK